MAFLRTKRIHGQTYYYLVESYREKNGKVKQRQLKYYGKLKPSGATIERDKGKT